MSATDSRTVALAGGDCVLRIAPHIGGAWTSLAWRGQPVLRETPEAAITDGNVRLAACYPLVPYSNRIAGARLRHAGRDYALAHNFGDQPHAIHGVGWQRAWSVVAATEDRATL